MFVGPGDTVLPAARHVGRRKRAQPTHTNLVWMPVAAVTLRAQELKLSAIYTLPDWSEATPKGSSSSAPAANPPSPE